MDDSFAFTVSTQGFDVSDLDFPVAPRTVATLDLLPPSVSLNPEPPVVELCSSDGDVSSIKL